MSAVTYSKTNGLYKDGICLKSFFKHDFETVALSAIRHDDGSISVDFHDSNGIRFIDVCDNDVDFLLSCDDPEIAFNYAYSLIPPSENTDNKTLATGEQVGFVEREGEALSNDVECYQRSRTLKSLETDVKLTESEIDALLILVNTELDADDRIFKLSELNAIRNKLLKASENFDLPSLLW